MNADTLALCLAIGFTLQIDADFTRSDLSAADRAYFRTMMRRQINRAAHRRMNTLLLLDAGWSAEDVARTLFLDEGTVRW